MVTLGERIKMARRKSGLSLRAVGEKVGVSHTAISKYERGLDIPSSEILLRLADALDVKLDYLFRPVHIALEPMLVQYRCQARLGVRARQRIQDEVIEYLERYLEVEALADDRAFFSRPRIDYTVTCLSDVERIALELRNKWELGTDPIDNLMVMLEDRGVHVCPVRGEDGFDGLAAWFQDGVPIVAVQRDVPGDRQRFDLAHELAHLLLEVKSDLAEEVAAHRFAAAFLVPQPAAIAELGARRHDLDPRELHLLKLKYGMSMQAWIRRARDLEIISDARYLRLCRRFSRMGWRKHEPFDAVPSEEPKRMRQLIFRALAEDAISRSRAEELLGERLPEVVPEAA